MNSRPHSNDISIGEDAWITFGDLVWGLEDEIQIDPYLAAVMPFLDSLETACVADCCGIDAFQLWPDDIAKATSRLDLRARESLPSKLATVQQEIANLPSDLVVSKRLNQYFRKGVFLELLAHIRRVVDSPNEEVLP